VRYKLSYRDLVEMIAKVITGVQFKDGIEVKGSDCQRVVA